MIELWNKAINYLVGQGVSTELATTYLIVSLALVVMALVALVMRIIVVVKYYKGNHTRTKNGQTSFEVAREALDKIGLKDVKIKKAGIFRAFFIGNSYSISKKTIYLRGGIADKNSITAVAMALQKVGIAKMHHDGNSAVGVRNIAQVLSLVGPILFIPVVLVGFVVDYALFGVFGAFSIASIVVGGVILASGFVATLLNLPVEKKANSIALDIMDKTQVLDKEEREIAKKVFDAYLVAYICEFIVAILRVVQIVLEIVMNRQINNRK